MPINRTPLPVMPSDATPAGCAVLHRLGVRDCQKTPEGRCREFLLRVVQPALVGLVDGSLSTLAPLFAVAYATGNPHTAFLVGVAASVGAGISMGLSEGLSDDGALTGRGSGTLRGGITGAATFAGGILHTLPFLLSDVTAALTLAYAVVGVELLVIAWVRYRFLGMPFWKSVVQVVLGGILVVLAGILLGSG